MSWHCTSALAVSQWRCNGMVGTPAAALRIAKRAPFAKPITSTFFSEAELCCSQMSGPMASRRRSPAAIGTYYAAGAGGNWLFQGGLVTWHCMPHTAPWRRRTLKLSVPHGEVHEDLFWSTRNGNCTDIPVEAFDDLPRAFLDDAWATKDLRRLPCTEFKSPCRHHLEHGAVSTELMIRDTWSDLECNPPNRKEMCY